MAQHFKAYEGKPLAIPAEAAGPKPEYLAWYQAIVFTRIEAPVYPPRSSRIPHD